MRRRVWAFIRQADILLSFQIGLPSMAEESSFESSLPRNIHDNDDFDEDCTVLPEALPDSESTQISFLIAKTKLAFGFARALKEICGANSIRWERVLEIDRELRCIYEKIPDNYRLNQLSIGDSLILTSSRFVLASIHHKSLCVIHSRFLEAAKLDSKYAYARRVCLTSAMAILRFQAIQNQKIPVDGNMRSLTNYQTSLAIHDYLLAATIISSDLSSNTPADNAINGPSLQGVPTRVEMIQALEISARIFNQMGDHSMEAYRAADVLEMLVAQFKAGDPRALQSLKDLHIFQAEQSSWLFGNSLVPNSAVENLQSMPQARCTTSEEAPSTALYAESSLESATLSGRTHQISQEAPHSSDDNVNIDGLMLERLESLETAALDCPSTWATTAETSFYLHPSPSSPMLPPSELSGCWYIPEDENSNVSYRSSLEFSEILSSLYR